MALQEPIVEAVHRMWFGPLDTLGRPAPKMMKQWFSKSPEFDKHLRKHFVDYVDAAFMGAFDRWQSHDAGLVALIVMLDQMTRNMFRDTPKSFAYDKKALATSLQAITERRFMSMPAVHAYFVLMPTMHSEDLTVQELGIKSYGELLETVGSEHKDLIAKAIQYAKAHRDIIAKFGRFPHRNSILGRPSTPEELSFLKLPGSSF